MLVVDDEPTVRMLIVEILDDKLEAGMHVLMKPFEMDASASRIRDIIASP